MNASEVGLHSQQSVCRPSAAVRWTEDPVASRREADSCCFCSHAMSHGGWLQRRSVFKMTHSQAREQLSMQSLSQDPSQDVCWLQASAPVQGVWGLPSCNVWIQSSGIGIAASALCCLVWSQCINTPWDTTVSKVQPVSRRGERGLLDLFRKALSWLTLTVTLPPVRATLEENLGCGTD